MYHFDRSEHGTVVTALVYYAMHVADPSECIRCLETLVPEPKEPWPEIITEGRARWRETLDERNYLVARYPSR